MQPYICMGYILVGNNNSDHDFYIINDTLMEN